jgi:hypothetical protein
VYKEGRRDGKMNQCNLAFHKRLENIEILYQNSRTTKQEVYNPKYTPKTVKLKFRSRNDLRRSNALQSIVEPSMPRTSL